MTAARLVKAEATALAAARREADFERHQAARRRRVAHLAPGVIVADLNDWPRGHTAGLAGHPTNNGVP